VRRVHDRGEGKKKPPKGLSGSVVGGECSGQVLEEMVEVAVQEVKALQGVDDLLAFAALAAVDGFDDYIGGDDVAVTGGGAGDFVGADVEVLFSEEGGEGHCLVCGWGRPR
jgi:hypothetical protein